MRLNCSWFAAALLVAGCASKPIDTFYADHRPAATATLAESDGACCQVVNDYLVGTDPVVNWPSDTPNGSYVIAAGPTKLIVAYFQHRHTAPGTGGLSVTFSKPYTGEAKQVEFTAEAGHAYAFETKTNFFMPMFDLEIKRNEWDVKVIDKTTKAVVAETHDRDSQATTKPAA